MKINHIYLGDCRKYLKKIKDGSIDMVITSPPYDDLREYEDKVKWNFTIFKTIALQLFRVLKKGGVIVWVVGDSTIKGSESGNSFKQALFFKRIGFNIHDTMIFEKKNYVPQSHNRYEQVFEFMFCFSKGKPKTFNPIKVQTKYKYFNTDYLDAAKNIVRNKKWSRRARGNVKIGNKKIHKNIFTYSTGHDAGLGHPAPFPNNLARDQILTWSNENDIILDPFAGGGTALKVAKMFRRKYIGIEIVPLYYDMAVKKCKKCNITLFD